MKTILLVTEQYDPTADNLLQVLDRRGAPVLRWNLDRYPLGSTLTYEAAADRFDGRIEIDGRRAPFATIGAVWYRALRCRGFPDGLSPEMREFANREAESALGALAHVTDWHWVNDPRRHREAGWKPAQLDLARRVGLDVPRTLVTNDPEAVAAFRAECGGALVYKPLSQTLNLEPGKVVFTSVVTDEAAASLELIRHTPGIFQELTPKAYEIRLTVVDGAMFAARVLSQQDARTALDWRTAPYDVKYEAMDLPAGIAARVAAFMAESGLVYSCLDFIVTPDGRHVFLESNPRGQYLWIEYYTGLPITAAIADALGA